MSFHRPRWIRAVALDLYTMVDPVGATEVALRRGGLGGVGVEPGTAASGSAAPASPSALNGEAGSVYRAEALSAGLRLPGSSPLSALTEGEGVSGFLHPPAPWRDEQADHRAVSPPSVSAFSQPAPEPPTQQAGGLASPRSVGARSHHVTGSVCLPGEADPPGRWRLASVAGVAVGAPLSWSLGTLVAAVVS